MFKVYRVNTKTATISTEELKEEYKIFGNRGLIAKVLTDEVNPKCDPLGPENKLIVCTGMLAGSALTTANRLSIGGKSPLTEGIKEANAGGNLATLLAQHGVRMIIFEDQPQDDQWYIFKIGKDGMPELIKADEYVGLNNYALVEKLHEKYGEDIGVVSIGVAGERLCKASSMQVTDFTTKHPARSAARGGLGAVTGSKKIKAVVVEKPTQITKFPYHNRELFNEANKKLVNNLVSDFFVNNIFSVGGTVGNLEMQATTGIMPVKNFSGEFFSPEKLEQVSRKVWLEKLNENGGKSGTPCQAGCLVKCSNVYRDKTREVVTSGFEYETIALCGPNCDIGDIDFTTEIDRICDDYGVDTIEFGGSIGVLMDIGKLAWGDIEGTRQVMNEMLEGKTELGKLMGDGTHRLGKAYGAKRIPTVKKQCLAGYEPRNMKGIGVTYATSPMGADHTAGICAGPGIDQLDKEGKVKLSQDFQVLSAAGDNLMCSFPFAMGGGPPMFPEIIQGALGGEWSVEKFMGIGVETLLLEKAWNVAAGFTEADDRLPDFMYEEKSPATGAVFDITDQELKEVFKF